MYSTFNLLSLYTTSYPLYLYGIFLVIGTYSTKDDIYGDI
jgi:hypothetical protein